VTITLNQCQESAVESFVEFLCDPSETELVIKGHAGTGKTTLVNHILSNLHKYTAMAKTLGLDMKIPNDIVVTATTRKAASVISKELNCKGQTIHSYLGLMVRNNFRDGSTYLALSKNAKEKRNTLLFIDESSFIDENLLEQIRAQCINCKIVFLGDPYQLLNVDSGTSPVFDSDIATTTLTTVMRNSGEIYRLSSQFRDTVKSGDFLPIALDPKKDSVIHVNGDQFQSMVDKAFTAKSYVPDVSAKIIAWTNDCVHGYNAYIKQLLGNNEDYSVGETYVCNSPIIVEDQIIANTDEIVTIQDIDNAIEEDVLGYSIMINDNWVFAPKNPSDKKHIVNQYARIKDFVSMYRIKDTWADVRPVYACTTHKSQGSTYGTVFINLTDIGRNHKSDELARLLYVAISRASKQVVLYGSLPSKHSTIKELEYELQL